MKRKLPLAPPVRARLEPPTIMDRALAAEHGSMYIQLAAFAIDVDRVYVAQEDEPALPFGWEVFVTECYLLARIDPLRDMQRVLLQDTCLAILEQPPEEQGYGSQLLFAVYDAVDRGFFPEALRAMFRSWSSQPKQLRKALDVLWQAPERALVTCAAHGLSSALDPPLASPTRQALEQMRAGSWRLPTAGTPAP
jgi:hypothetical protein